jgi:signal transduction histidine kinase/phage shock protein PspC (stress-responsive transcriptional regulator)
MVRSAEGRLVGGVAAGLSAHLGVDVRVVRAVFVLLALANGLGVVLYAAFWACVPLGAEPVRPPAPNASPEERERRKRRLILLAVLVSIALVLGILAFLLVLGYFPSGIVWSSLLVTIGMAILWRQVDDAQRARWLPPRGRSRGWWGVARAAAGAMIVGAGIVLFLATRGQLDEARGSLLVIAAAVVGLLLIAGPYLLRIVRELDAERWERIRSQERAELAAHVHDSVLHTLTLIQRHAEDPRQVLRLARAQERQLRAWLYRPADADEATLAESVRRTAAEIEDAHGARIDVVCVGDRELDERLVAQVQAAREAMVNAAKYAGDGPISVYVEVEPDQATVFVRDRGSGFDLAAVPADRLGVRESIIGRMRRNGGKAVIRGGPGEGTEVQLEMALTTRRITPEAGHPGEAPPAAGQADERAEERSAR